MEKMEHIWHKYKQEFPWLPDDLAAMWVLGLKAKHEKHGWKHLPAIFCDADTLNFIYGHEALRNMLGVVSKSWFWRPKRASEYRTYLASTILSIESLGCDFAGWGTHFPEAKREANLILETYFKGNKTRLLDIYMPLRAQMDQEDIDRTLGPKKAN